MGPGLLYNSCYLLHNSYAGVIYKQPGAVLFDSAVSFSG